MVWGSEENVSRPLLQPGSGLDAAISVVEDATVIQLHDHVKLAHAGDADHYGSGIERAKARRPQGRDLGPGVVLTVIDAIGQRRVEVGADAVGLAVDPVHAIVGHGEGQQVGGQEEPDHHPEDRANPKAGMVAQSCQPPAGTAVTEAVEAAHDLANQPSYAVAVDRNLYRAPTDYSSTERGA